MKQTYMYMNPRENNIVELLSAQRYAINPFLDFYGCFVRIVVTELSGTMSF